MKLLINLIRNLLGGIIAAIDFITRGTKLKRTSQAQQQVETELEKISLYHVIDEPVTADQLFNSGGVVTEGGEVPAERSVSGGFFGVGGQEVS